MRAEGLAGLSAQLVKPWQHLHSACFCGEARATTLRAAAPAPTAPLTLMLTNPIFLMRTPTPTHVSMPFFLRRWGRLVPPL